MKFGFASAIMANNNYYEVIDLASEIGYDCVEVMCWPVGKAARRYAGVTHIDINTLDESKIEDLLGYSSKKNVEISALGYYPNPLDPDKETSEDAVAHIIRLIQTARKMGLNNVNTFIGKNRFKTTEENIELFKAVWPRIIEEAEKNNVYLGIENCPMYFTKDEWPGGNNLAASPHLWEIMFKTISSEYFGLNYDPSHLHLQGMDYIKPIYDFKDKMFHIHFKDILVYQDKIDYKGVFTYPSEYSEPKLPGLGGIDWARFVSALYDIRYKGAACVEVEDRAFEGSAEDVKKALMLSFNYLKQYV